MPISTKILTYKNDLFVSTRERVGNLELNAGALFVLPVLLLMTAIIIYPLGRTIWLSFHRVAGFTNEWIGLSNYMQVLTADWFFPILQQTAIWTGVTVAGQTLLGLVLALLLNTKFRGRAFVRGLMLLPWVTPGIVVAMIWSWMYHPRLGIINRILLDLGLIQDSIAWLAEPNFALYAVILAGIWKGFPFAMVMILAGLQDINPRLYLAAKIDGAPWYARFYHITLPGLAPVLKVVVLLSVIWTFNFFTLVLVLTGGGPAGASDILPHKVYTVSFAQFKFGLGAALAVILFLIMLVWMAVYAYMLRKQGGEL